MLKIFKTKNGFTMIEIITVLVILGILAIVTVSRMTNYNVEVYTGTDVLKEHLRYAQTIAMNYSPTVRDGNRVGVIMMPVTEQAIGCLKEQTRSDIHFLPEDSKYVTGDGRINLTAKRIRLNGGFTIYFDNHGIPYTAYTNSTTNNPLDPNGTGLAIIMTSLSGSNPQNINITPLTGFIP